MSAIDARQHSTIAARGETYGGRWHGKALQPAELAIILEQRALGHGKELIKRALAREGFQRSTESIRGHLDAIKRREAEASENLI